MSTSRKSAVLKDVVAFVDVWSSDKTANYSKPFIQQLQEMGAQVSKTFNKHVTHVVFNNGHPATWRKAKKSDVQLVSVLWIGRCHDDGAHVSEDLYPAVNDERNPALKNKRHRCMQPKDSPERTPENDRRMRKKLDKMMKDLALKQPVVTDVSSIIIDEENGIVYSPSLKRSEYMAKRLRDMKDKRENLSPTASQMVESPSPTSLRPSLGNTPTLLQILYNESDDDSSASVAEVGYSPDKEEGRTLVDVEDQQHVEQPHIKDSTEPWLSPCRDSPTRFSSLESEKEEKGNKRRSGRSSVRKKPLEKNIYFDFSEEACLDRTPSNKKDEETSQPQIIASSPSPNRREGLKLTAAESFAETKSHICLDTVKSPSCSAPAVISDAAKTSKEPPATSQKVQLKTPKQAPSSLTALLQSFTRPAESKSAAAPSSADRDDDDDDDDDDDVFEDFFSPANNQQRSKKRLLSNLPVGRSIHIPFDLGPVPTKRKQRSESLGCGSIEKKKRKLGGSHSGKNVNQQFDTSSEPPSLQQQDVKESLPALDSSSADVTLMAERKRQRALVFARTGKTTSETLKLEGGCRSAQPTALTEDDTILDPQKNSEVNINSEAFGSRGNDCTEAAGVTEIPPVAEETHNKPVSLSLHKMVHKTKVMRTLVMTSMPTEKQHTVVQVVKALGGFSLVDRVCESTTHVVSGEHRRTLNILLGIARGCWILSFEWILWCLEQRQWVPEEPYELSDQFPAAQICRLQRHLSAGEHQQDLFQGQPTMFVSQHSQPPTQSLAELIELCGGTVCKAVRQAGICIGRYSGRRPEGSRVLSEQWVLDCITQLKRLSYDSYDLE